MIERFQDKKLYFQSIDRSILETILCKETSKDIWDSMRNKYQGLTRANRQQLHALRSKFKLLKMNMEKAVINYFSQMMAIVNKM
jgi:hypothetical protein